MKFVSPISALVESDGLNEFRKQLEGQLTVCFVGKASLVDEEEEEALRRCLELLGDRPSMVAKGLQEGRVNLLKLSP